MDSIRLLEIMFGKHGETCHVSVSNGDIYTGIFNGYSESSHENPLILRLKICKREAERIGVPFLSEIGVRYEVINSVDFPNLNSKHEVR